MRGIRVVLTLMVVVSVIGVMSAAVAGAPEGSPPPQPDKIYSPQDVVYGKCLGEWLEAYWRWYYAGCDPSFAPPQKQIVFLPLPDATGNVEVTMKPGTSFVLPMFAWCWEKYLDGSTDTPIADEDVPATVTGVDGTGLPVVTLDGCPILQNFWDYYSGTVWLDPPIDYAEPSPYNSTGIIALQSVGFISAPLTPGDHIIRLQEYLCLTGQVYDNTWIIHVVPPGK